MSTSSCITHIVQYSCLAPSLKAVMQKKGGEEKKKDRTEEKEGVKAKLGRERERKNAWRMRRNP